MNKITFEDKYVDELIELRKKARTDKDYKLSDEIRDYLDSKLIFIFDIPDGEQNTWFMPETYFKRMECEYFKDKGIRFENKRKYVEYRIEDDRKTEKSFESWLFSQFKSMGYS